MTDVQQGGIFVCVWGGGGGREGGGRGGKGGYIARRTVQSAQRYRCFSGVAPMCF